MHWMCRVSGIGLRHVMAYHVMSCHVMMLYADVHAHVCTSESLHRTASRQHRTDTVVVMDES